MKLAALVAVSAAACGSCGGSSGGNGDGGGGACGALPAQETGDGTYYAADGTGNCSFDASPNDLMVAAMNSADYADARWCGACLDVTGPMGEIVVRVVDQCPGCKHGDLDLSQQAFEKIAPLSAGRVSITWQEVACPVSGPMQYRFKEGSSQYWTAIQVRDHRNALTKLEVQDGSGAFADVPRLDYNYFVAPSGMGTGPYTLRVTDDRGQSVVESNVVLGDGLVRTGSQQLPACK